MKNRIKYLNKLIIKILFIVALLNALCTLLFLYLYLNSKLPIIFEYAPSEFPPIRLKWIVPSVDPIIYQDFHTTTAGTRVKVVDLWRAIPMVVEAIIAKNPGTILVEQASKDVKVYVSEDESLITIMIEFLVVTVEN